MSSENPLQALHDLAACCPPPPEPDREPAVCPECQQGKHGNCDDTAWDNEADELCLCACSAAGH